MKAANQGHIENPDDIRGKPANAKSNHRGENNGKSSDFLCAWCRIVYAALQWGFHGIAMPSDG